MSSLQAVTCSVSVLMPTFQQAAFIGRAISSLLLQTLQDWELLIVDDGSEGDDKWRAVQPWLCDHRIRYRRLPHNRGLGAALNEAMAAAQGSLIAYLPSDDVYYRDHLSSLAALLEADAAAIMACSGLVHHYNRRAEGRIDGYPLQLVQVMHRRCDARWMERAELVTDDLDRMFWHTLQQRGSCLYSGQVSCEWVDHPQQRHKRIREPEGGINAYRQYYRVNHPLRFHSTVGNAVDESAHYRRWREPAAAVPAFGRLKILLVGELAYNAERIVALAEQGHALYGLWMENPYWYNTVGPLPFAHVEDLDPQRWQEEIRRIAPDVIYAQLNWQAVPLAHQVLRDNPGIAFVWHFKEGPFICLEKGSWPQLAELYREADGRISCSPEMQDWFDLACPPPPGRTAAPQLVLDGDLPKADWFAGAPSPRLSLQDGQIHTVVPGRPIGLHPEDVAALAAQGIHLHFYGDFTHGQWRQWIDRARALAPRHLHLHAHVDQSRWLAEFSQYDAGWLHSFVSSNGGELQRANWDDLNYPARIGTFAVAGIPMIQRDNRGAVVASQTLVRDLDIGLFYQDADDLAAQLRDAPRMQQLRESLWEKRQQFSFDHHVGRLVAFFREAMRYRSERRVHAAVHEGDAHV